MLKRSERDCPVPSLEDVMELFLFLVREKCFPCPGYSSGKRLHLLPSW